MIATVADRGMRVAYVDIDAHHGDGVQAAFYESDQVLTISLHESGRFLFPGTGFAEERGSGRGAGYSINVAIAGLRSGPYSTLLTGTSAAKRAALTAATAVDRSTSPTATGSRPVARTAAAPRRGDRTSATSAFSGTPP